MNTTKLLLAGTCLALGFSAPAFADVKVNAGANVNTTTTTDVTTDRLYNADGEVVSETTTTTTTKNYVYDTNNDRLMDRDEYITYSYDVIDYNHDGVVDQQEWDTYTSIWYEPVSVSYDPEVRTFVSYDVDGDGRIDMTEYRSAYDAELYSSWDLDQSGMVDYDEYTTITKKYMDLDKDGVYDWVYVRSGTN